MCLGFVRNFASFAAVRALLGVAEGGLLPGMVSLCDWDNSPPFAEKSLTSKGAVSLVLL